MKQTVSLHEPIQAHRALMSLWPMVKATLMAGHRMEIEVRPERRSSAENRLLHAMLGYIAKTHDWAGQKRDSDTWKRLLTAAWCRARGESTELLPALDGRGVDIVFRHTSKLSRAECAELIEFIYAWSAMNDIQFPPPPVPMPPKHIEYINVETGEITA